MIVWARPAVAVPGTPFCAVIAREGRSVVTACRGRWEADPGDELRWEPAENEKCGGCRRELGGGEVER